MTNDEITLEICSNTEWLREHGRLNINLIPDGMEDEAADDFGGNLHRCLTGRGFKTESARGQRMLYHGWNGANLFKHSFGAVATFDELTAEQEAEIEQAVESARELTMGTYCETHHSRD